MQLLVAALVALGLSGCSAGAPSGSGRPSPAATHVQPSEGDPVAVATSPAPTLGALVPVNVLGGLQANGPVVARRPEEQGPASLPRFTPKGNALFATYSCLGPGKFAINGLFTASPCDGVTQTALLRGQAGKALTLRVTVDASTRWRLLLQDGQEASPPKQ